MSLQIEDSAGLIESVEHLVLGATQLLRTKANGQVELGRAVDVTLFGAVGDGVADDTVAIQAAIDAASDGDTVYFPAGDYKLTRQTGNVGLLISARTGLSLVGGQDTRIFMSSVDITSDDISLLQVKASSQITISGFDFDLDLTGAPSSRHNARVLHVISDGAGTGSTHITIRENRIKVFHASGNTTNRALYGFYANTQTSDGDNRLTTDIFFINNVIHGSDGRLCQYFKVDRGVIAGNIITGSPVEDQRIIRLLGSRGISVVGNIIDDGSGGNTGSWAIIVAKGSTNFYSERIAITGNYVALSSGTVAAVSIGILLDGARFVTISGNVLEQVGVVLNSGYGIRYNDEPSFPNTKISIVGNVISGWNAWQIFQNSANTVEATLRDNILGQTFTSPQNRAVAGSNPALLSAFDNLGYVTENDGTATVASGNTTVTVTHGLDYTPDMGDIKVTPTNNLGNASKFWISSPGVTTFVINVDSDPGASTATFAWQIRRT